LEVLAFQAVTELVSNEHKKMTDTSTGDSSPLGNQLTGYLVIDPAVGGSQLSS